MLGANALRSKQSLAPGEVISGRYIVEDRLGRGGMAAVFRVRDSSSGQLLALKRLENTGSQHLSALFELEYHTLAGLKHPNIVEAYEYAADERGPYYTMELLTGVDLRTRAPVPWPVACKYAAEAAYALSALHARKLIHRDVSPRNLWCTEEGRIKLIDFGALAPFGTATEVVGTPSCVAPEALRGGTLDQRADIYALGAVLYWLLTGAHAYPARTLRELPSLWASPLMSASRRVANLQRNDLPPIPQELDALLESMLAGEPVSRPRDAGDFIDRIGHFMEANALPKDLTLLAAVPAGSFVGRKAQQAEIQRRLDGALSGHGSALLITGKRGEGRSRMLTEAALNARLAGATVIEVDGTGLSRERSLAVQLSERLLNTIPQTARAAAKGIEARLAHISPHIAERLETRVALAKSQVEQQADMLQALIQWFSATSRQCPLMLVLDGVELADDESIWLLAGLAREARNVPLLLLGASSTDTKRSLSVAEKALSSASSTLALGPLTLEDVVHLLGSMFDQVPNLQRLAERTQRASGGNPARLMALITALVQRGVISNVEGTWVLHQQLDEEVEVVAGELAKSSASTLSPETRTLARRLAVRRGTISLEMCRTIGLVEPQALANGLSELVRAGVLHGSEVCYRFVDEHLRAELFAELTEQERAEAHTRLGNAIVARGLLDLEDELEANVHLLHSSSPGDAMSAILRSCLHFAREEPARAGKSTRLLEETLRIYDDRKLDGFHLAPILASLVMASYYSDRVLATRYGDRALRVTNGLFHPQLRDRMRPWLGRKLSFFVALLVSAFVFFKQRKRPAALSFRDGVTLLFGCVGSLSGAATICTDSEAVRAVAATIEPWTVLGPSHTATIIHQFALNLATTVQDHPGEAHARWLKMIQQLEKGPVHPSFPDAQRKHFLNGALYAAGVLEAWRDDAEVLKVADRLENTGAKTSLLQADQLRAIYYSNQGNLTLAASYAAKIEQHAIHLGTAWQVEVWSPPAQLSAALRSHDAMTIKRNLPQTERLAQVIPSLNRWIPRMRGAHLLLRRRYREALPYLEQTLNEAPRAAIGWGRSIGGLVAAYSGLGEYERARDLARQTLALYDEADLTFTAMYLGLQTEYAIAEAGAGNPQRARELLSALSSKHQGSGVLTRGQILCARIQVARIEEDLETAEALLAELSTLYRATSEPPLLALVQSIERDLRHAKAKAHGDVSDEPRDHSSEHTSNARLDTMLSGAITSHSQIARGALELMADELKVKQGFIWLVQSDGELGHFASLGEESAIRHQLEEWVREQVADSMVDVTQTMVQNGELTSGQPLFTDADRSYALHLLTASDDNQSRTVGAVVFPVAEDSERVPSAQLLQQMGMVIYRLSKVA